MTSIMFNSSPIVDLETLFSPFVYNISRFTVFSHTVKGTALSGDQWCYDHKKGISFIPIVLSPFLKVPLLSSNCLLTQKTQYPHISYIYPFFRVRMIMRIIPPLIPFALAQCVSPCLPHIPSFIVSFHNSSNCYPQSIHYERNI